MTNGKGAEWQIVVQIAILKQEVRLNGFRTVAAFDQDSHSAGQCSEVGPPPPTPQTSSSNDNLHDGNTPYLLHFKFSPRCECRILSLGDYPAYEFYVLAFETSFKPEEFSLFKRPLKMDQTERFGTSTRNIRRRRISQNKEHNINILGPEMVFFNFSTPCVYVNNTGTKYIRIMKQTTF